MKTTRINKQTLPEGASVHLYLKSGLSFAGVVSKVEDGCVFLKKYKTYGSVGEHEGVIEIDAEDISAIGRN
ncbi:MAG: hypothetical protein WCG28_03200 [bacterium]